MEGEVERDNSWGGAEIPELASPLYKWAAKKNISISFN